MFLTSFSLLLAAIDLFCLIVLYFSASMHEALLSKSSPCSLHLICSFCLLQSCVAELPCAEGSTFVSSVKCFFLIKRKSHTHLPGAGQYTG